MNPITPKITLREYLKLSPTKKLAVWTFTIISGLLWYSFSYAPGQISQAKRERDDAVNRTVMKDSVCQAEKFAMARDYESKMQLELRNQLSEVKAQYLEQEKKIGGRLFEAGKVIESQNKALKTIKKSNSTLSKFIKK